MRKFKAESQRLMDLMVHSIYTNKEIFLRELISNASDAIDKMYVKSLQDENISFDKDKFYIELIPNKENKTLVIRDTGIGMTKEELESNLGTIAKSGSADFKKANSTEDAMNIIGQFGVGFYSAFMVAKKVQVLTRAYGSEQAYLWESEGAEGYTITEATKETPGTEITLTFKDDEDEEKYSRFLEEYTLKELVRKYSNYVRYPIQMEVTKSRKVENPIDETADEKTSDESAESNAEKTREDSSDKAPEWEEYTEVETLNSMVPIWDKPRNQLTDEDYKTFYQQEHFGYDEPLAWTHMITDGTLSYRAILYIPSKVPYDFYTKDYKKGLELYSAGVKIMDHAEDLVPDYYAFVKGVVASEDLSLNISREILQQDRQLLAIARKIESKITDELKSLQTSDPDKYAEFFENFGNQIKGGIYQSYGMKKDQLADLLLFHSSNGDKPRTLQQYVTEKKPDQTKIYYATGDSVSQIDRSPSLGLLKDQGYEVLYLTDDIDEFMIKMMFSYEEMEFQSILSDEFELESDAKEDAKDEKEVSAEQSGLFEEMKKILDGEVVEVKASKRLKDDAVLLVATGDVSIDMEKTFLHQPGDQKLTAQKVLEINTKNPVYDKLTQAFADENTAELELYTKLLYDQARLIEGLPIADAVTFAKNVQKLMV